MTYPFADSYSEAFAAIENEAGGGRMGPMQREAAMRLALALRGRDYSHTGDDEFERLVLCYTGPMLAHFRNGRLTRKYLAQESKIYARRFENEMRLGNNDIIALASDRLNMDIDTSNNSVGVVTYLRHIVKGEPEWELVNQAVHGGRVFVTRRMIVQMIAAAIFAVIQKKIEGCVVRDITGRHPWVSADCLSQVREAIAAQERRAAPADGTPPCMLHCAKELEGGANLPHPGRFALAAFWGRREMEIEPIISLFANAPNFSRSKTAYQVNHIVGREMRPYNCDRMDTLGLCFRDDMCGNIKNPLQYGRSR